MGYLAGKGEDGPKWTGNFREGFDSTGPGRGGVGVNLTDPQEYALRFLSGPRPAVERQVTVVTWENLERFGLIRRVDHSTPSLSADWYTRFEPTPAGRVWLELRDGAKVQAGAA